MLNHRFHSHSSSRNLWTLYQPSSCFFDCVQPYCHSHGTCPWRSSAHSGRHMISWDQHKMNCSLNVSNRSSTRRSGPGVTPSYPQELPASTEYPLVSLTRAFESVVSCKDAMCSKLFFALAFRELHQLWCVSYLGCFFWFNTIFQFSFCRWDRSDWLRSLGHFRRDPRHHLGLVTYLSSLGRLPYQILSASTSYLLRQFDPILTYFSFLLEQYLLCPYCPGTVFLSCFPPPSLLRHRQNLVSNHECHKSSLAPRLTFLPFLFCLDFYSRFCHICFVSYFWSSSSTPCTLALDFLWVAWSSLSKLVWPILRFGRHILHGDLAVLSTPTWSCCTPAAIPSASE